MTDQADRLRASEAEAAALRTELEETNRGLVAVYAELSAQGDQLELARATAEQASQAKAAFLANMSHEIRSPLNAVIGFTSLLIDTALDTEQAEYAEMIRAAGNHLRGVIDDILDLSKIESGRLELEDIAFDLVACVEEAVGIVAPKAEENGLALAALFAADTPATAVGDPVRLRQVLVNLLSNAVKFTGTGQVTVEVRTEPAAGPGVRLAFDVTDTGVGIPADALDRIFAPFTQADTSTTRNFGGTGLGLAICRQLSERMGGGISVRSAPGVGSTFTCVVEVGLAEPTRLAEEPEKPLSDKQILVIHEQLAVAEAICRHLRMWGGEIVTAPSVDAAVLRADEWSEAALAVLGVVGPADGLDGDIARLAAYHRGVLPVVATAPLAVRRQLPAARLGVVGTPIRRAQLRTAVLGALGQAEAPGRPAAPTPARPARVLRILLAEDNPVNQRMAAIMLDRLGHHADVVDDGAQAVDAILAGDYDLVLMDVHMPRIDGIAATREARWRHPGPRPRIVAMTASATDDSRRACLDAGMDGFLTKPVEAADLARVVDRALAEVSPPSPRHVLYVDDNPMIIALVERILKREPDLTLVTAARGGTAIELATERCPDLIFLDLNLPDMSGQDLLRRLRADPRTRAIPAVVVSGDIPPEAVVQLNDMGVTDYLVKPFDPDGLRAMVDAALPRPGRVARPAGAGARR
ncbi:MAG: hypothetical protein AUI14_24480 [Actinobacteria bacterium 13_2_20CM_2_71_6]|nr:MAG: hypothetical protein AUI14_24480 [Actinobacteria bacterium 13_2_20CM_2_71_6]